MAESKEVACPTCGSRLEALSVGGGRERTGRVIDLKTWPEPFAAIRAGLKPWELRKNDRDYQVGDVLRLREWLPPVINAHDLAGNAEGYTGEIEDRLVTWMLHGGVFGLPEGYVIMSLSPAVVSDQESARSLPGCVASPTTPTTYDLEAAVIRAARSLDACASEFGLESGCCGEHLDALWTALDRLRASDEPDIGPPTPLGALKFRMEQAGHTQADLAKLIGSRSHAAEILSGKRSLSKAQIVRLVDEWGIPARSLLGPTEPIAPAFGTANEGQGDLEGGAS